MAAKLLTIAFRNMRRQLRRTILTGLTFAIAVQFITGVVLWMNYSAGAQSAWESVYYIQDVLPGGWVLRGTAQIVLDAYWNACATPSAP